MKKAFKAVIVGLAICLIVPLLIFVFFLIIGTPRSICSEGNIQSYSQLKDNAETAKLINVMPTAATNINYFIKPYGSVIYVDFSVSTNEFTKWCLIRGWKVNELKHGMSIVGTSLTNSIKVKRGVCYKKINDKLEQRNESVKSLTVLYDYDTERCYYRGIRQSHEDLRGDGSTAIRSGRTEE